MNLSPSAALRSFRQPFSVYLPSSLKLIALPILLNLTFTVCAQIAPGIGSFRTSVAPTHKTFHRTAQNPIPFPGIPAVKYTAPATIFLSSVVKDSSGPQTIMIENTGSDEYAITDPVVVAGPDAADFKVTSCPLKEVTSHSPQCPVVVVYTPQSIGVGTEKISHATITIKVTKYDATAAAPVTASIDIPLEGQAGSTCQQIYGYAVFQAHILFPLNHPGIDETTINCYYSTGSNLAFATQVQYQYNPSGSSNTLSGDLMSVQFPLGLQLSLTGNASTSSCPSTATGTTPTPATSTSCGSTGSAAGNTTGTTPTLQQDIQNLEQGGDFAIKVLWPVLNHTGNRYQIVSVANPRVGFTVNGLSAETTITNATDINFNLAHETYAEFSAIPSTTGGNSPASVFADYRWGLEHVSSSYENSSSLTKSNFLLQQIEFGIAISGSLKISADRYFGPNQVYVDSTGAIASANNFSNWSLRVQITPSSLSSSN